MLYFVLFTIDPIKIAKVNMLIVARKVKIVHDFS